MGPRNPLIPSVFALLALLLTTGASAQSNEPLHRDGWILAAAHAPGLKQSIWRTDLWIYQTTPGTSVTLTFCKADHDNAAATAYEVATLPGEHVTYLEDVVEQYLHVGSGSWLGAIHYAAASDVQVWARVYSISPDGSKSYGQLVEGIRSVDMSPDSNPWHSRDHQWLNALKHTADGRFRVNVGVINPTAVTSTYTVQMYDETNNNPPGGPAHVSLEVPRFSMAQLTDPFASVNGGDWNDYHIRVVCETEGGGTFAYASVVDNATNDAFFVRGVQRYLVSSKAGMNRTMHSDGWILAAAHSPGLASSIWRTDLWLHRENYSAGTLRLYFCRTERDGTNIEPIEVPLLEGQENFYFEDIVEQFLHVGDGAWLGAIRYVADDEVQVWARVYSISADGQKSYGQLVEGVPTADMSPDNEPWDARDHQYIFAAKHTADGRYRVNFGVVNPTAVTATYALNAFDATGPAGSPLTTVALTVKPYSMVQLTDPLASLNGGEWSNLVLRVQCSKDGGGTFAYASVVDNATNDAYFVRGVKLYPYPTP